MFDFSVLDSAPQQTSVYLIVFGLCLTLVLSLILVFTYEKTSRQVSRPDHFIQSLLLMSLVTATIMQSIGDSLALSFGIFGALAIIRFRTRISDPRDVAFVFASMAVGISCGVHSFVNGIIGTLGFCLVVLLIRFSPFGQKTNHIGVLRLETPEENTGRVTVPQLLERFCSNFSIKRIRLVLAVENPGQFEFEYKLKLRQESDFSVLVQALSAVPNVKISRLSFDDENDIESI
ncbi:MAG: DUF4956 domain-containing protein [Saprospiraceae bacterium]|nr:DUF4956 domain-containing protein [Saprospiraceae bacterium]